MRAAFLLAAGLAASVLCTPPAHAHEYAVPPSPDTVVGEVRMVKATADDTLPDIARRYEVGYEAIRLANPGVDTWLPGKGTEVVVPSQYVLPDAPHEGIVVNVPEMRLYYFPKPRPGETPRVFTYPISVGRGNWQTPLVVTKVVRKEKNPAWRPPESIRAEHAARGDPLPKFVPAGPDNPLGDYALRLSVPGYLIHGTNKPYGIGMRVTHGCIRLYPEDINALFHMVPVGTPVRIVNQPVKVGWLDHRLYMEVHPAFASADSGKPVNLTPVVQAVVAATGQPPSDKVVNWDAVYSAARLTTGIPTEVSRGAVASAGAISTLGRTD